MAAAELLHSHHPTLLALIDEVGFSAFQHAVRDLIDMLRFSFGLTGRVPATLLQRSLALVRKTAKITHEGKREWMQSWVEGLFQNNARFGHRWANSLNVAPSWAELGLASNGSTRPLAHLQDQELNFGKLWEAENDTTAWGQAYLQARSWALQQRASGQESVQELLELVNPKAIRTTLATFKSGTSTGLDFVKLSQLKQAPDEVIQSLSEVLQEMVVDMIGPEENLVSLHLIAKKLSGFRSICTFNSLWRILLGCMASKMRLWDMQAALPGDTSVKGASVQMQMAHQQVLASTAVSEGLHHAALLWDITGFYEYRALGRSY
jgi:hypothetical protein